MARATSATSAASNVQSMYHSSDLLTVGILSQHEHQCRLTAAVDQPLFAHGRPESVHNEIDCYKARLGSLYYP